MSYLLKQVAQILDAKFKGSELFDNDAENEFPRFNSSELELGNLLGQGRFCDVFQVSKISLREDNTATSPKLFITLHQNTNYTTGVTMSVLTGTVMTNDGPDGEGCWVDSESSQQQVAIYQQLLSVFCNMIPFPEYINQEREEIGRAHV